MQRKSCTLKPLPSLGVGLWYFNFLMHRRQMFLQSSPESQSCFQSCLISKSHRMPLSTPCFLCAHYSTASSTSFAQQSQGFLVPLLGLAMVFSPLPCRFCYQEQQELTDQYHQWVKFFPQTCLWGATAMLSPPLLASSLIKCMLDWLL